VSLGRWSRRRCNSSCASLSLSICSLRVLNSSLDVAPGRAKGTLARHSSRPISQRC
jgi:hypothetical protein